MCDKSGNLICFKMGRRSRYLIQMLFVGGGRESRFGSEWGTATGAIMYGCIELWMTRVAWLPLIEIMAVGNHQGRGASCCLSTHIINSTRLVHLTPSSSFLRLASFQSSLSSPTPTTVNCSLSCHSSSSLSSYRICASRRYLSPYVSYRASSSSSFSSQLLS